MKHLKLLLLLVLGNAYVFGQKSPTLPTGNTLIQLYKNRTTDLITGGSALTGYDVLASKRKQDSLYAILVAGLDLKVDKTNFININDLGGIGDSVFNNTSIINSALITYREVYFPAGDYLVDSLVNKSGSKITGPGRILKAITGGNQQLNIGNDVYNNVFGQEYLYHFHNKRIDSGITASLRVLWSGDSTTEGIGLPEDYKLHNLFSSISESRGVNNVTSINVGHSGETTVQWKDDHVQDDIDQDPDLYIVRWGINDASGDLNTFKNALRSGLALIRSQKSQSELSILLMSPNSVSDTPNGRDEKWFEQVKKVYADAARDYQCAYIDTYDLWLDSRNGAAGLYMDNPYGDGRAIHPGYIFNTWIVSKVFDFVFPSSTLDKIRKNKVINESSTNRIPLHTDLPSTYDNGLTISRVLAEGTGPWPEDGSAFTIFNADGAGGQFNLSRLDTVPEINYRSIIGDEGLGETLIWSDNVRLWHSGNNYSKTQLDSALAAQTLQNVTESGATTNVDLTTAQVTSTGPGAAFNFTDRTTPSTTWAIYADSGEMKVFNTVSGSNIINVGETGNVRLVGSVASTQFKLSALNTAPSSSTDTGAAGEIRITAAYIYVCIAANTWVRTALTTW